MKPARRVAMMAVGCLVVALGGCGTEVPGGGGQPAALTPEERDAGAMADLQASEKWTTPSCRWLQTGNWVIPGDAQEDELYRTARALDYIEMDEAGRGTDRGGREQAWRVALTDAGRIEAAKCPASRSSSTRSPWGLPVSQRRFMSGRYVEENAVAQITTFEVEYEWVPTAAGEAVRHVLTGPMAVNAGTFRTRVYLRKGADLTSPSPNGWWVSAIDDLSPVRLR